MQNYLFCQDQGRRDYSVENNRISILREQTGYLTMWQLQDTYSFCSFYPTQGETKGSMPIELRLPVVGLQKCGKKEGLSGLSQEYQFFEYGILT